MQKITQNSVQRGLVRVGLGSIAIGILASFSYSQNVQVTMTLPGTNGGPTGLYDSYLFFADFPGSTTNSTIYGPYALDNGSVVSVKNPNTATNDDYSYMLMGLYSDSSSQVHVAVSSANDLSGKTWDSLFNANPGSFGTMSEATAISELTSGNFKATLTAVNIVLGYQNPNVTPAISYSNSPYTSYITGFSTGEGIGSASSQPVPAPGSIFALGLPFVGLLIRRRK